MARRISYELIDDLDESVIPEGTGETIAFSVGDSRYVLDLSQEHADAFRKDLERWVSAARPDDGPSDDSPTTPAERRAIRAWASDNKVGVGARGQIPRDVVRQYRRQHAR
jgi:hypothetical protein